MLQKLQMDINFFDSGQYIGCITKTTTSKSKISMYIQTLLLLKDSVFQT